MRNAKDRFLIYELGILTLKAALSTRDAKNPIYNKNTKSFQRTNANKVFREYLSIIEEKYSGNTISEDQHIAFITEAASDMSIKLSNYLHNGKFRIGVTQKFINLHLKYLWAIGFCAEPPHCPIDGIIRDFAGINYNWTSSDSIEDYLTAIASLRRIASKQGSSLAQWELESFRRREDED